MRRSHKRGLSPIATALIASVLIAIGLFLAQTKEIPFRHHFEIKAAFRSANGIRAGSPVRMAGVNIGKVTGTRRYDGDAALVTLRISTDGLPIHADTHMKIRPRLFLEGNFFVDVTAGTPTAPVLHDGAVVPVSQTATPVQFDQVLDALNSATRADLSTVLDEYGRALRRGAKATNRTFRVAGGAYRDSAVVADAQLGLTPHDLSRYIEAGGRVSAALHRYPRALPDLVTGLHLVARGFTRDSGALEATLAELPRTLAAGLPALRSLDGALPPTRRLARDLLPALRTSVPALDATLPLARQLRGLVRPRELQGLAASLRAATPDLVRANESAVAVAEQTRAVASCLNTVLIPWSLDKVPDPNFPALTNVYRERSQALPGLAGESRSGDANGSWFRVLAGSGSLTYQLQPGQFFQASRPVLGTNPPAPAARPPLEPHVACETQRQPDLRTNPGSPPRPVPTSLGAPGAQKRFDDAQDWAVRWLRGEVAARPGVPAKVRDGLATARELGLGGG